MKQWLKKAAEVLVVAGIVGALCYFALDESGRDHNSYALSFGLTEEGARHYAEVCDSLPQREWPMIEKWVSQNPYDVSEETRNGMTLIGCIACDAVNRQREEAHAEYLAERQKIRERILVGDILTPDERSDWGEEVADAQIELYLRKQCELEEERQKNWPPPGYYPAPSTGP